MSMAITYHTIPFVIFLSLINDACHKFKDFARAAHHLTINSILLPLSGEAPKQKFRHMYLIFVALVQN